MGPRARLFFFKKKPLDGAAVNRRRIFTPNRRAIETPLIDGVERVGDRSCVA